MTNRWEPRPWVGDEEIRAETRDVLTDALQWRLSGARWQDIRSTVGALRMALRSGDTEAVRALVTELELQGPVRGVPIGRDPMVQAPDEVIEEINELVDAMDDFPPSPPSPPSRP